MARVYWQTFGTMEFQTGSIEVRPMQLADVPLVSRWMNDPRVLQYFGGRDNAQSEAQVRHDCFDDSRDERCLFTFDGVPIGYIQFCPAVAGEFGFPVDEPSWGIDLYIGEPGYWNRGIGTQLVRAGAEHLLNGGHAKHVTIDPEAWNLRAVRCYEKAGFIKRKLMLRSEWHEGELRDNWLMVYNPAYDLRTVRLSELPDDELAPLVEEGAAQGFEFVPRLASDFHSGRNRFDKPGEALFGVYDGALLAGVGGLNIDHYANDPTVGRVRHVYVRQSHRRRGVGRALLMAIITLAQQTYAQLNLRTNTAEGARFYESLEFSRAMHTDTATHTMRFAPLPEG